MKYAVISSDVNPLYSFYLPILGRAWEEMGYTALYLLVGEEKDWKSHPEASFALERFKNMGLIHYVSTIPNREIHTVAQVSRLYASAIPSLKKDDYLLTTDADMIPLSKSFFNKEDKSLDFHLFTGNGYDLVSKDHLPVKFPMCYLGASVSSWKEVMGIKEFSVSEHMKRHFAAVPGPARWDHDEMTFATRIKYSDMFSGPVLKHAEGNSKGRVHLMNRFRGGGGSFYGRLDGVKWWARDVDKYFSGLVDCHFCTYGYKFPEKLLYLLSKFFPSRKEELENYVNTYPLTKNGRAPSIT